MDVENDDEPGVQPTERERSSSSSSGAEHSLALLLTKLVESQLRAVKAMEALAQQTAEVVLQNHQILQALSDVAGDNMDAPQRFYMDGKPII